MSRTSATPAFLREILEGSPEPMLVADEAGTVRYANAAAERFHKAESDGLLGLPVLRLIPDWFALPASCRNHRTSAVLLNGSSRTVMLSLSPVQTSDFIALVAVFREAESNSRPNSSTVEEAKLHAQVQEQESDLAEMHDQLSEGARILEHHLPSSRLEGIEAAWIFQPCRTLGGDMIFLHRHEDKLVLGVLDVSGHGVAASLLAIGLARALSPERGRGGCTIGRKGALRQPREIVSRLNKDSQTLFESGLFVTLLFGILNLSTGEFCFTSAGHPSPILVKDTATSELTAVFDPPLGVERTTTYHQSRLELNPGELLVLYTDGVTECRSPSREMFGEQRLLSVLAEGGPEVFPLVATVSSELGSFRGNVPASDDVSFLAVRVPPRHVQMAKISSQ